MSLEKPSLPDSSVCDLTVRKNINQQDAQDHQLIVPIAGRLPYEVLQMIFKHCLRPNRNATMNPSEAPLLLGRVCNAWRQISFSTPQLWSTIHIDSPRHFPYPDPAQKYLQYCEAVEAWLRRSSNLPLSISIDQGRANVYTTHHLLNVVVKFSLRWKQMAINSHDDPLAALAKMTEADVPLLKTVVMTICPPRGKYIPFLHTSSLRSASLSLAFLGGPRSLPIRWKNITNLSMWGLPSARTALAFLRACPNLIVCKLKDLAVGDTSGAKIVKLPWLKLLRVKLYPDMDSERCIPDFFRVLHMPNLLHFEFHGQCEESFSVSFQSIFAQQNIIDTFDYALNNVPMHVLLAILTKGSSIRRLRLNVLGQHIYENTPFSVNNAFLARLTSDARVCPALEELDMRLDSNSDITEEALLQFIISRTDQAPAGAARLQRVHVTFAHPCRRDIMPDLRALVDGGLRVQISYPQATGQIVRRIDHWDLPDPSDGLSGLDFEFWAPSV